MHPTNATDSTVAKNSERIVTSYIGAFNAHNVDTMLEMVTDGVQWLTIDGEKITVEAYSKDELRGSLIKYFEACGSCRSRLTHVFSTDSRVSVLEVASFETSKGAQEQQSVSLYEFSRGQIKRVYYFPAEE